MILGIPKRMVIIVGVLAGVILIYVIGVDENTSAGAAEDGSAGACRVIVTADILNVRAGPSIEATVIGQYERDTETDASKVVRNGYRKLSEGRWAADRFLDPVDGAECG